MKNTLIIVILLFSLLSSCSSKKNFEYSTFKIEGKEYNGLIQNRHPYYDIGSPNGDVRMGQISLDIDRYDNDTLSGTLTNSETDEGLLFPQVELYFESEKDSIVILADSLGKFKTNIPDQLKRIKVNYVGFETLTIDLSDLKQ